MTLVKVVWTGNFKQHITDRQADKIIPVGIIFIAVLIILVCDITVGKAIQVVKKHFSQTGLEIERKSFSQEMPDADAEGDDRLKSTSSLCIHIAKDANTTNSEKEVGRPFDQ